MMEDAFELKRLDELALRAGRSGRIQYTRFLEPSLKSAAEAAAGRRDAGVMLYGGYPDAERVMAAFYGDAPPEPSDFPMRILRIEWNPKFASPGHRDLLGAVLGLGIEREAVGDIAMAEWRGAPCACLFASEEMADYIAANLDSAGRAAVKVRFAEELPRLLPPEGRELRVTVQNPRLDAVIAAGWHLSRAEAQRLVAAGLVKLNHEPNLRGDARIDAGDMISAKGHGRLKVVEVQGQSRRGRLALALFLYGK